MPAGAVVPDGIVGLVDEGDVLDDQDDLLALRVADDVEGGEKEETSDLAEVETLEGLKNNDVVGALGNDPAVKGVLLAVRVLELDLDLKSTLLHFAFKAQLGSEEKKVVLRDVHGAIGENAEANAGWVASLVSGKLDVSVAVIDVRTLSPLLDTCALEETPVVEDNQLAFLGGLHEAG